MILGYKTCEKSYVKLENDKKLHYYKMSKSLTKSPQNKTKTALKILNTQTGENLEVARKLFEEYHNSLDFDLCFQNFGEELANLPGDILRLQGVYYLRCIRTRRRDALGKEQIEPKTICEMKRLYVRPQFQRKGIEQTYAQSCNRTGPKKRVQTNATGYCTNNGRHQMSI